MSKIHLNLTAGPYRHPLCYFDYRPKGDVIIAPLPASSSGLHMTFHKSFCTSGKVHISDDPRYGFDEWASFKMPDASELENYLSKMAYNPDHGEDILVHSYSKNYKGYYQKQISNENVNLDINLNKLNLTDFSHNQVPMEILPKYFQASPLDSHIIIDETTNSVAIYNKRNGISLNFSMETIEQQVESMPFVKDIMQPMKRAINHTNELVSQGKIPKYEIFPKEVLPKENELNKLLNKIEIKKIYL